MAEDDDVPQLSASTLAALQEFYQEQNELREIDIQEDWQLSQFWYDDQTAGALASEVLDAAGVNGKIACLCTPTLFKKLRSLPDSKTTSCTVKLFEFDERFSTYGDDYIFYDYNKPLEIAADFESAFDIVVADPPFLSEACQQKTAETVKFICKKKIIMCTGAVMKGVCGNLLGLNECHFKPRHTNNLANEFICMTNYTTKYLNSSS
ncbi:EEF1A lysine methyltransferase 1-like [Anneissia japonica]|uniref:EEF1A lysine methyltransferase 1-like n=1 Tax=Anneissia japonica TaxID=1529436 RepID=UPI0014259198|nr:EEF1A lysine methyltransferase 1-like [Anneissia japonica]